MAWLTRREQPPASALRGLDRDERVVSWADVAPSGVLLATQRGLWWPDADADGHRLIGWQLIDKAVWREGVLTVIEAEVVDDLLLVDRPPLTAPLAKPRDLPPTVRKRIESNIVRSELHPVHGGAARFVARRVPGRDGVVWWARLEGGAWDSEPVRAQVQDRLATLRTVWSSED